MTEDPKEEVEELLLNLVITKQNQLQETVLVDALLITVQWDTGSAVTIILLENNEQTQIKQENKVTVQLSTGAVQREFHLLVQDGAPQDLLLQMDCFSFFGYNIVQEEIRRNVQLLWIRKRH